MHNCYACDRVFSYRVGGTTARFPLRFEGPPAHVNGGIIAGSLACPAVYAADRADAIVTRITARVRASVPHETPLSIETNASGFGSEVRIMRGDAALVSGAVELSAAPDCCPGTQIASIPDDRSGDLASLARVEIPDRPPFYEETGDHPIPGCFSCGPKHSDGLHIYPRVAGDGLVCAPWTPAGEFDEGGGALSTLVLTSALDCSSGICLPLDMQRELLELDQFFLLGSLDVRYLRIPAVGAPYRVTAKMLLREGRKFFGLSALFDEAGTPYAYAEATWIVAGITRTEAFGSKSPPHS